MFLCSGNNEISIINIKLFRTSAKSNYSELLLKTGSLTMLVNRMKFIAIEVFKRIYNLNPAFMQTMFVVKEIEKDMRDPSILILP